jgi:TorA maturation chaperone TorD
VDQLTRTLSCVFVTFITFNCGFFALTGEKHLHYTENHTRRVPDIRVYAYTHCLRRETLSKFNQLLPADQAEFLTGQALLFGLLGRLLYQEPDRAWISDLYRQDVFTESPFAPEQVDIQQGLADLQSWSGAFEELLPEALFKDLQADYMRLFVGTTQVLAAPWESVYFSRERLVFQQQTLAVRSWYRRFGLEVEKLNQEPDDHIGLQLSFLAHLAGQALQALEAGEEGQLNLLLAAQHDFLKEHLFKWEGDWYALVLEHARTPFYRGVARLAHGALAHTASLLDLSRPLEVRE